MIVWDTRTTDKKNQANDFIINLKKLIAMSEKTFDDYAKKDEDPKDTPR